MSYFYDLENPGMFGILILRDTGTELFRTHKPRDEWDPKSWPKCSETRYVE
jgi:hypothetical protein